MQDQHVPKGDVAAVMRELGTAARAAARTVALARAAAKTDALLEAARALRAQTAAILVANALYTPRVRTALAWWAMKDSNLQPTD